MKIPLFVAHSDKEIQYKPHFAAPWSSSFSAPHLKKSHATMLSPMLRTMALPKMYVDLPIDANQGFIARQACNGFGGQHYYGGFNQKRSGPLNI